MIRPKAPGHKVSSRSFAYSEEMRTISLDRILREVAMRVPVWHFDLVICKPCADETVSPGPGLYKDKQVAWGVSSEGQYSARIRIWNQMKLSHREPVDLIVKTIPGPDSLKH